MSRATRRAKGKRERRRRLYSYCDRVVEMSAAGSSVESIAKVTGTDKGMVVAVLETVAGPLERRDLGEGVG